MTCSARSRASRREQLQDDEADRRADPVERGEAGDDAGDEEGAGHDVAVVVVEQVGRREDVLGAGAAGEDEVVPVEVAAEGKDSAHDQLERDQEPGDDGNPGDAGRADCHVSFHRVGRVSSTVRGEWDAASLGDV